MNLNHFSSDFDEIYDVSEGERVDTEIGVTDTAVTLGASIGLPNLELFIKQYLGQIVEVYNVCSAEIAKHMVSMVYIYSGKSDDRSPNMTLPKLHLGAGEEHLYRSKHI